MLVKFLTLLPYWRLNLVNKDYQNNWT